MSRILMIDDDKRIRDIIKIQLQNKGYELFEAGTREEAVELLKEREIHLILCDIKMKEVDGISLLREFKTGKYPHIPVIMLTGFIDKATSDKARAEGCFDFITKPVKRQKLIETIEKALA